jgi:hypothetical protein
MNAVPVEDYTKLDGCLNVASYFPRGAAKSDLGKVFQGLRPQVNCTNRYTQDQRCIRP